MIVKNNYNDCITNVACSIRKYFDLEYHHNTNKEIDNILEKTHPNNVVIVLFDGMGSNILKRTLNKDDFFIKHLKKEITSVFPATTTAATTSIRTGLDPVEHGWLGWNTYIKPIDKTITLFLNAEKGTETICKEFLNVKNKLINKTIVDEINDNTKYYAKELFPFGENKYNDLDDMINIIKKETKRKGKKYIYAYDSEPDSTMHNFGPDHVNSTKLIKERNEKIYKLSKELKDTLLIVVADHGHKLVNNICLEEYPDIVSLLERTTSLEQRAVSFKIKENKQEEFKKIFNKHFSNSFKLYDKNDIINSHLFGYGNENELFESAIGDFIAIADNSNDCLVYDGDDVLVSQHAGYSNDEIYIPLIIVPCI